MKRLCLFLILMLSVVNNYGQKPLIDTGVYNKWPTVNTPSISNDGKYVAFVVNNSPINNSTLVIQSSDKRWRSEYIGADRLEFSRNSQIAAFMIKDSLFILKLRENIISTIGKVSSFILPKEDYSERIFINRQYNSKSQIIVYNYHDRKSQSFNSISNSLVSENGKSLILVTDSFVNKKAIQTLDWIKLDEGKRREIWKGDGIRDFQLDDSGTKLAFILTDTFGNENNRSCHLYHFNTQKQHLLFNNQTSGIEKGMKLTNLLRFNKDGTRIIFCTERLSEGEEIDNSFNKLRIWSYLDKTLQSKRLTSGLTNKSYYNLYNIESKRIIQIDRDGDRVTGGIVSLMTQDNVVIWHIDPKADMLESRWNPDAKITSELVSTTTGKRTSLDQLGKNNGYLSPGEKFIIYNNGNNYYSYDIRSKTVKNITYNISTNWLNYYGADQDKVPRGIVGWLANDRFVLIYDRFDIWKIDPMAKFPPTCITNRYGEKNNIIFFVGLANSAENNIITENKFLLNGTNVITKDNGFFITDLTKKGNPDPLIFGAYAYNLLNNYYVNEQGMIPLKARFSNKYILTRMNSNESINYFITEDFKKIVPLSNVHPEKKFNWYTTELHEWKSLDGKSLQGVLYKPENFDSTKKYPVILNYYDKKSFNLNVCLTPEYSRANIDIPTYVSNGYLVFTPDIQFRIGDPMQGTLNSVVSAAQYLAKFKFVDSTKMGIQGFSFGGIQTTYLVANTHLFAAACAGSGQSDFVSAYGTISRSGSSLQSNFDYGGQNRMGGAPWELKDMYVKNSAIFNADKVTTPFLIMHTTNDDICPFSQATEIFTALRRLKKKVWMLEYTDGAHTIHGKSAIDFDIRMRQFFDHYLKGRPAPKWMLESIGKVPDQNLLNYEKQSK